MPSVQSAISWRNRIAPPAGTIAVVTVCALGAFAASASGQTLRPVGTRSLVNTYNYGGWQQSPAVAADADGHTVVVWRTSDSAVWSIHGQLYGPNGARVGSEFPINTSMVDFSSQSTTVDKTASPGIAMAPDHTFVVVWADPGPGRPGIIARRFDAVTGAALTPELVVSTAPLAKFPSVAAGVDSFVVVWLDTQVHPDGTLTVVGQRYSNAGIPIGSAFSIGSSQNEYYTCSGCGDFKGYDYIRPRVGSDTSGNFTVVWKSSATPAAASIGAKRFDSEGQAIGDELIVAVDAADYAVTQPSIAVAPSGNFVVVWTRYGTWLTPSPWDVWGGDIDARFYSASGSPMTDASRVNSGLIVPGDAGLQPAAATDSAGKFAVAWRYPDGGAVSGILARSYTAAGTPLGDQMTVDSVRAGDDQPAIASTGAGNFLAVWHCPVSTVGSIYAQRLKIPADLRVSAFTAPARTGSGANVSLTVTILNQGGEAAPPSGTEVRWSRTATPGALDPLLASWTTGGLNPGQSEIKTFTVNIPFTDAGVYYFVAVADAPKAIAEADENNNSLARAVLLGPDLTVSSLTLSSTSSVVVPGSTLTIHDIVQNIGGGSAASSAVAYVLSADATATSADTVLGVRAVALQAGASSPGTTTVTLPGLLLRGRTYYLIAVADATNAVDEVSESNNSRAIPITIW